MNPSRFRMGALGLLLAGWFGLQSCPGAERREWITLTNCQLVTSDYNDGDSFHIRSGTNDFIARLYFVDAPETNLRYAERTREQSEYFGVTLDETMKAGRQAAEAVRTLLREPFSVQTRRASAAGQSKQPRFYCFVEAEGQSLAEWLVAHGLARTKGVNTALPGGMKAKAYVEKLKALEAKAREKRAGIWAGSIEKNSGEESPK